MANYKLVRYLLEELIFVAGASLSAGTPEASSGYAKATEKPNNLSFLWFLAVAWSNRRRLLRGDSDNLETPQGVA